MEIRQWLSRDGLPMDPANPRKFIFDFRRKDDPGIGRNTTQTSRDAACPSLMQEGDSCRISGNTPRTGIDV
jgi:hypothetical protein